jgi:hypothetical protein
LKKINNQVLGLDISSTAIDIARARFPDIAFDVADVNNVPCFADYLGRRFGGTSAAGWEAGG